MQIWFLRLTFISVFYMSDRFPLEGQLLTRTGFGTWIQFSRGLIQQVWLKWKLFITSRIQLKYTVVIFPIKSNSYTKGKIDFLIFKYKYLIMCFKEKFLLTQIVLQKTNKKYLWKIKTNFKYALISKCTII